MDETNRSRYTNMIFPTQIDENPERFKVRKIQIPGILKNVQVYDSRALINDDISRRSSNNVSAVSQHRKL